MKVPRIRKSLIWWGLGIFIIGLLLLNYKDQDEEKRKVLQRNEDIRMKILGAKYNWVSLEEKLLSTSRQTFSEAGSKSDNLASAAPVAYVTELATKTQTDIHDWGNEQATANAEIETNGTTQPLTNSTEWMNCSLIKQVFEEAKLSKNAKFRLETDNGNRAVYFTTVIDPKGDPINVVVKFASKTETMQESHIFRYRSALLEISNLRKLRSLNWKGIPDLLGVCVSPKEVTYVVTKVPGVPICNGTGFDMKCAVGNDIKNYIKSKPDPAYSTLLWLTKVTCFFQQFEDHHVFMEDLSGINLYYNPETFDIYIVDADSLLFYGDVPIYSRTSCRGNEDCPLPKGNFWGDYSLNKKIYSSCYETFKGYCIDNMCRGFDSSLHACGIASWLLSPVRKLVPAEEHPAYADILHCMMLELPEERCSIADVCDKSTSELIYYEQIHEQDDLKDEEQNWELDRSR